jgi:hypothetical protein
MRNFHLATVASFMSLAAGCAFAAVSAEEAKQLGDKLTLTGATQAGNKEGTIPAYAPTPIKAPAGWDPKSPGNRPDPFNEKPLFTITAQNAPQYADKLDGMMGIFKQYPNYRMDIYPTHRTAMYPKSFTDNAVKNATSCKTSADGNALVGCYGGTPFPIPKSGIEAIWNKLTSYRGHALATNTKQWIVPVSGSPILTNQGTGAQQFPSYDPARTTPQQGKDIYWAFRLDYIAPTRQVGEKLVLLDPIDQVNVGRRAYQYIPGQRRVKLAPDLAYDTPSPVSGGGGTMDSGTVFLGAPDRYDWKLVGKKEKFIAYNNFTMTDPKACPFDKLLTRNFPNPECMRFELHRVWVVKATLKPGFRHILPVRDFYLDEDQPGAAMSEGYDAAGKLFRVAFNVSYPMFQEEGVSYMDTSASYELDMQKGSWFMSGGANEKGLGFWPIKPKSDLYFSPEALAGEGIR